MDQEKIQLIIDMARSGADVRDVTAELKKLESQAKDTAKATDSASKSTGDFGRSALETGRIVQDFAQGGLGGVINNIEGFARAIGGGPGLAGGLTLLGVGFLLLKDPIMNFVASIKDGANEVPKSTSAIEGLNTAIAASKKRLGELAEQQSLTNKELDEYKRLVAETERAEKQLEAERESQAATKAAREQKTNEQTKLAGDFGKISGGADFDRIVANAGANTPQGQYNALKAEYDALAAKFRGGTDLNAGEQARYADLSRQMNAIAGRGGIDANNGVAANQRAMEDLVNAARKGDAGAFNQLLGLTTGGVRDQLDAIDPSKAGARAFNQKQAESQISDAIGGFMTPIINNLKEAAEQVKAEAKVNTPGPGRGAAIDAVREMNRERERAAEEELRANEKVGRPAAGRGAAIDAVNEMKAAAEQMASQVGEGVDPMWAAVQAMQNLAKAQGNSNAQMAQMGRTIAVLNQQVTQMENRRRQEEQITRSRMSRVPPGSEAQPDGAVVWAELQELRRQIDAGKTTMRTLLSRGYHAAQGESGIDPWAPLNPPPMPAPYFAPSLLDFGNW